MIIIIKNIPYFSLQNKLYESPSIAFISKYKSKFIFKKGKIDASLKLPKNSFNYDEVIPFEVDLNCSELDLKINGIELYITRQYKKLDRYNHTRVKSYSGEIKIFSKYFEFKEEEKCYITKDIIEFPKTFLNNELYPPKIYEIFDSKKNEVLDNEIKKYFLYPCSYKGIITIEYCLVVKIKFDSSFTFDEYLRMPLDFHSLPTIVKEEFNEVKKDENSINDKDFKTDTGL